MQRMLIDLNAGVPMPASRADAGGVRSSRVSIAPTTARRRTRGIVWESTVFNAKNSPGRMSGAAGCMGFQRFNGELFLIAHAALGDQQDRSSQHEDGAADVEDRGPDAAGAGQLSALLVLDGDQELASSIVSWGLSQNCHTGFICVFPSSLWRLPPCRARLSRCWRPWRADR